MYVCMIYIYAVCAHTCTICTSQPKHTRSWRGMQDWPCRYQALVSVKLSWQAFLCVQLVLPVCSKFVMDASWMGFVWCVDR